MASPHSLVSQVLLCKTPRLRSSATKTNSLQMFLFAPRCALLANISTPPLEHASLAKPVGLRRFPASPILASHVLPERSAMPQAQSLVSLVLLASTRFLDLPNVLYVAEVSSALVTRAAALTARCRHTMLPLRLLLAVGAQRVATR